MEMLISFSSRTWHLPTLPKVPKAGSMTMVLQRILQSQGIHTILSAQIQSNAAKLSGWRFIVQVDNDLKHAAKATQEFLKVKKVDYSSMAKSISWSQPDWACISLAENKTKGRKTHKQTTTEVSCSKRQAKHHKGGNPGFGDVHEFQT